MAGVFKYLDRLECFHSNAVNGRPDIVQSICTCWLVPFDKVFPYVASNPVFYLACFWILLYHLCRNPSWSWASWVTERLGTPTETWRMISRHIVILNLYYNPRIAGRFQFTTSVFAILVDDCLLYFAVPKIMEWIFGEQQTDSGHGLDSGTESVGAKQFDPFDNEIPTPVSDTRSPMADSTYQDLTRDFSKVLGLFIMQAGLFTLYVKHMNAPDAPSKDRNQANFFYWCLGVLIQLFSSNVQLGRSYNPEWWKALAEIDSEDRTSSGSGWDQLRQMFPWKPHARELGRRKHRVLCVRVPYSVDWTTRRGMDWFVNAVIRETLKFTTPILVNSEEPLDFVKDCMAIFFLTQLDDLTEEFSLSIFELRALVKIFLHRSKCRELCGMTLYSFFGSEGDLAESFIRLGLGDEEGGLQQNLIRQVELTEDERKAVEAWRRDKKVAWRRVNRRDHEFHKTQVRNLIKEVLD